MHKMHSSWLVGATIALLAGLVWAGAPVDLIPSNASWGSVGEMQSEVRSPNADGSVTVMELEYCFAEGFARDLAGLRLADAEALVRSGRHIAQVVSNNFVGQPHATNPNNCRLDFTVVLGRVVRVTVG